jgi:hypothetical protein
MTTYAHLLSEKLTVTLIFTVPVCRSRSSGRNATLTAWSRLRRGGNRVQYAGAGDCPGFVDDDFGDDRAREAAALASGGYTALAQSSWCCDAAAD